MTAAANVHHDGQPVRTRPASAYHGLGAEHFLLNGPPDGDELADGAEVD